MKSLNIKLPFSVNDLINFFYLLPTRDLQRVSERISQLLSKRNSQNSDDREVELLSIINQKMPKAFLERFEFLKSQLQNGILTKDEKLEMEAYVEKLEEFDTEKINALDELAKLKNIPFTKLAKDLQAFPRNNA